MSTATSRRTSRLLGLAAAAASLALVGTSSPAGALPAYTTSPTTYTNPRVQGQPKIMDLRVSEHRRFDRIVLDVQGRRPSFTIRYVRQLRYDASGDVVPLNGRRKLLLTLSPAQAHGYTGPVLRQYHLPVLRGVAKTGDFEGVVSFGFTARRKAGYRIFELTHPTRVVIDLKH